MKVFRGFRVFEYALSQKTKTQKCQKIAETFLNKKKTRVINGLPLLENCWKATDFISKHDFGFHNKPKTTFKLQW